MKNNLLNSYVSGRLKAIKRQLSIFEKEQKKACLHRIRVEIKKIRAMYSFARKMYALPNEANELQALYRDAGEIRKLGLNIKLIGEFQDVEDSLPASLKEKEKELTERFLKEIPTYMASMKQMRENLSFPAALPSKKNIEKYLAQQLHKVFSVLDHQDKRNLHRFRKRLKKLMYVHDFLPEKLRKSLKLNEKSLYKLQKKIGIWHDTSSAIRFFSTLQFTHKDIFISTLTVKEEKQISNLFRHYLNAEEVETLFSE